MSEPQLAELFAGGTAPERDGVFVAGVAVTIGRARLRNRLLALGLRAAVVLTLAAAVFAAGRLADPALASIAGNAPHFMGVPVPVVLGVLFIGLAVHARRHLRLPVLTAAAGRG